MSEPIRQEAERVRAKLRDHYFGWQSVENYAEHRRRELLLTAAQTITDLLAVLSAPPAQDYPRCRTCVQLRPLKGDVFACPVLNARLHASSLDEFGCIYHERDETKRWPDDEQPQHRPVDDLVTVSRALFDQMIDALECDDVEPRRAAFEAAQEFFEPAELLQRQTSTLPGSAS